MGVLGDNPDCRKLDLDLACPGGGPGDGVSGSLSRPCSAPLRHLGPSCACELMVAQPGAALPVLLVVVRPLAVVRASEGPFRRPSEDWGKVRKCR